MALSLMFVSSGIEYEPDLGGYGTKCFSSLQTARMVHGHGHGHGAGT